MLLYYPESIKFDWNSLLLGQYVKTTRYRCASCYGWKDFLL